MVKQTKTAEASLEALHRIFTVPEAPHSTLGKIEQAISQNLNSFLQDHITSSDYSLTDIEKDFSNPHIPEQPAFVSDHTEFLLEKLVAQSVHTSSPRFIGHMTSALPYFLMPLSKIMIGLNQNTVKIETSKAFTPLERQVLGMLHNMIYQREEAFYQSWMHSAEHSLGAFCSGGTIANITALWVARNAALRADGDFRGVAEEGLFRAMRHYGYDDLAILVSERGHYSLKKAADVLGIGRQSLIAIPTDANNRICIDKLETKLAELKARNVKVFAIVGVAGTTETGNIDPLDKLADIAGREGIHFHVDAAWGGASLMSQNQRPKLKGIERADSVTIDAHKQLYVPMGAGMVIFKDPSLVSAIEHHADYILRKGSKDLGSHTLEGSRSGMAMLLFASLNIIGREGYQLLIDQSVDKARYFADLIQTQPDFELISEPELCLLTYRYVPEVVRAALEKASPAQKDAIHSLLNDLTVFVQKHQREAGNTFVSRTTLKPEPLERRETRVFRVVLANPLTTHAILQEVLVEQREIAKRSTIAYPELLTLANSIVTA
ncbi:pyridoxal-dependent aspartate 1-decarboxylase PanP [Enterovibrio paralichthyis]|uniref:pyridoxal-dependent aspartate 1-decarboxylase PanP n=1 Tax=Enterovibrio paralichthyis TaxID=2853805 RepID=UPI001C439316|nr:putative pyridoxal-dependent aspartate 1-decarboxylase [Enterovibrio paralichthyis]MBV7299434.1 putative pyridoxal-dependent aspartate 1-decarboxylase [Enterovibrio paralichthyis]